jgi:hypothetical protein
MAIRRNAVSMSVLSWNASPIAFELSPAADTSRLNRWRA